MHCSPLRCPYSNSEQRAQLCGAAGPEGSQQHGCSGTVTTRGHGHSPAATRVCAPALCFVPRPPKAPEGPRAPHHGTHAPYRQAGRHTRGARRLRVPLLRLPRLSRPQQTQDGAAQSRPSPRPHSSAATGQQRPGQRGERGRQLPLTSPGPGWAGLGRPPALGGRGGGRRSPDHHGPLRPGAQAALRGTMTAAAPAPPARGTGTAPAPSPGLTRPRRGRGAATGPALTACGAAPAAPPAAAAPPRAGARRAGGAGPGGRAGRGCSARARRRERAGGGRPGRGGAAGPGGGGSGTAH